MNPVSSCKFMNARVKKTLLMGSDDVKRVLTRRGAKMRTHAPCEQQRAKRSNYAPLNSEQEENSHSARRCSMGTMGDPPPAKRLRLPSLSPALYVRLQHI
ncbi:hypothetical protein SCP_0607790 [Sparassis crispa]|uniref:Uncharacterized protein n=1 Tax=Sparassis crispa TaxID=139825 RepID=A0A401GRK8_9APHY|nr:hypothetical protein SCP_0607790 [Sparassis crispa]GBE84799.1 hypothetical protein SCP_0607790 [Sparassis crispa]